MLAGHHDIGDVIYLTRGAVNNQNPAMQSGRGVLCEKGAVAKGGGRSGIPACYATNWVAFIESMRCLKTEKCGNNLALILRISFSTTF